MTTDEHEEAVLAAWQAFHACWGAEAKDAAALEVDRAIRASERARLIEKLRERARDLGGVCGDVADLIESGAL